MRETCRPPNSSSRDSTPSPFLSNLSKSIVAAATRRPRARPCPLASARSGALFVVTAL